MSRDITLRAPVELGFLPTHVGFLRTLVPGEDGRLPRTADGSLAVVESIKEVMERSRVAVNSVQIPSFGGTLDDERDRTISELQALGLGVHLVMMVGGVDPMNPADEDAAVAQLVPVLEAAKRNGVKYVASTSIEQWMEAGAKRKEGAAFEAAVAQNVKLHSRVYREACLGDSTIEHWDIEFLRPGEFATFTDVGRLWILIQALNEEIGAPFFRCMIDAAHCGDSALGIAENRALIAEIARGGGLGVMHASAKTTRGCLSTDDGWVGALFEAAARSGKLSQAFVEMFNHEDEILAGLRELDPGHGVDTTDGRDYTQVVADGLEYLARVLNNYVARGYLKEV